jgi:hypothetical protein
MKKMSNNHTPLPVQLEYWIKIVENKRSPMDLKANAVLHLRSVRDTINNVLDAPTPKRWNTPYKK